MTTLQSKSTTDTLYTVKRNFRGVSKDYWGPLENIEKIDADAVEITESVRSLPGIK